jgi:hypothetical protein
VPKLYVAVRQDLPPGLQAAQAVHAAIGFALAHPALIPETVILVGVPGEDALIMLSVAARRFTHFLVREPDLGNVVTAIAIEPAAGRLCAGLPLLLKEAVAV